MCLLLGLSPTVAFMQKAVDTAEQCCKDKGRQHKAEHKACPDLVRVSESGSFLSSLESPMPEKPGPDQCLAAPRHVLSDSLPCLRSYKPSGCLDTDAAQAMHTSIYWQIGQDTADIFCDQIGS